MTSNPPPIGTDHLEPALRLARRMARFWRAGLATFAISLAAILAAAWLAPKQYRSEAVVYYKEGMQWAANESGSPRRVGQRLKDVLLARAQLAKIIEDLHLYPKLVRAGRMSVAVEEMRLAIGFRIERESDVFVISYTGDSPAEAQQVTARLTEVLVAENARLGAEQAEVGRQFLDAEKKRNEAELAAKVAEQLRFLASHPEFAQDQTTTVGVSLRARKDSGEAALESLRREEERLRLQLASPGQTALVLAKSEAEARLRAAQRELTDRRARFTEQHPDVRVAETAVRAAEETLRRAAAALEADKGATPPAVLQARLARVQRDIAAYSLRGPERQAAPAETAEGGRSARGVVALEAEWARLNREVAEARERLQQLDTKQFTASMTASLLTSGQTAQLVVIDPAFLPPRPIGTTRTRLALMAAAMAFVLAIGAALFLAMRDDTIYDHSDVEKLRLAPLLAEVPALGMGDAGEGMARRGPPGAEPPTRRLLSSGAWEGSRRGTRSPARAPGPAAGVQVDAGAAGSDRGLALVAISAAGPPSGQPEIVPRDAQGVARLRLAPHQSTAIVHQVAVGSSSPESEDLIHLVELVRVHRAPPTWTIDARLLVLGAPDSAAAAGFRILRQRLGERRAVRSILVTSPVAGEGKTLCAVNLALALGEAGRARVLLVEANFRKPSLARLLGFQPPVCVSAQLEAHRARSAQPWVVVEAVVPWLHTVAVTPSTETGPILDGRAFASCVEDLRGAGYDYIVIDSPSILGSADVNLVQEAADGVLVALWAGKSHARPLGRAIEQIGTTKLLGVALLGT